MGGDHPLKLPCQRLVELVADGTIAATTTVEAVQELVHVRARRRPGGDAAAIGRAYATLLAPLPSPRRPTSAAVWTCSGSTRGSEPSTVSSPQPLSG